MRTLLFLLLLSFSSVWAAQHSPFFDSGLPDDSVSFYLKAYEVGFTQSDMKRMDEIRNILQQANYSYTDKQRAIKLFLDANYNMNIDLYDKASENFSASIKLSTQNSFRVLALYARNGLATVEYSLNDIDGAIRSLEEVLEQCQPEDQLIKGRIHGNLAALYFEKAFDYRYSQKAFDSIRIITDNHYQTSIATLEEIDKKSELARVYAIYARSLIRDKNYALAHEYLVKADTASVHAENQYRFYFNQMKWADYYKEQTEYTKARPYLYEAMAYFKKVDNKEMLHYSQLELAINYAYTQTFDSAYFYSITLEKLRKKMSLEKMGRQSRLYKVELGVFDKERKIEEQKTQIALQQYQNEIAEARTKRWLIIGISVIVVFILIAVLLVQNIKQKAETEKNQLMIQERESAFRAVLIGQEKERKRIAQELHDGIGQQLSGIKMALQNVVDNLKNQNETVNQSLQNVVDLVSVSASDVRLLAHQMLPQVLIDKGLEAALKDLVQIAHQSSRIKFNIGYQIEENELSEVYELTIYRCIQELVNNTMKHAEATEIEIHVYENNEQILVAYSDNGKGISEGNKSIGIGLSGIKNRIENLSGRFTIENTGRLGFSAIFKLPMS